MFDYPEGLGFFNGIATGPGLSDKFRTRMLDTAEGFMTAGKLRTLDEAKSIIGAALMAEKNDKYNKILTVDDVKRKIEGFRKNNSLDV